MSDELLDIEHAKRERDKRLRRGLLFALYTNRRSSCWTVGRTLRDLFSPASTSRDKLDDDRHAEQLLTDLVSHGVAESNDTRTHKTQRQSFDYMEYRITAKGTDLIDEAIPAIPSIDDPRI